MKKTEYVHVCEECGSDDVETRMWMNLKTGHSEPISNDLEDNWCNRCEDHVSLMLIPKMEKL